MKAIHQMNEEEKKGFFEKITSPSRQQVEDMKDTVGKMTLVGRLFRAILNDLPDWGGQKYGVK